MRAARVTVALREDTALCSQPLIQTCSGKPIAWLEVGEYEVGLHGSPAALRRLAQESVIAAEQAEALARHEWTWVAA
jgi:hypothetical protein